MKVVIQRVQHASVVVDGQLVSEIGNGMMVLHGVEVGDTEKDLQYLLKKTINLRIFDDAQGVMNESILQHGGEILCVSQFTLLADTHKGNRPSYIKAERPEISQPMYDRFCQLLGENLGKPVQKGIFGADMKVTLLNDGPVTIIMDSKNR
ncbi:D-aminoacyl-tRNA deacylase [Porphyromonas levii]|uniref:D-aminoacyl-tRNA deacylase n=1 Tax=Porphyromonas levii TaxID=28114 RepID=UPI000377FE65|nr:D-aminoacyl-tRNA deacylase [Porphyromonas levii]MBR8702603.1 D-aminoacyl-tRNA deacylase [Porphyromonas levii]MBR8712959.1 D-aminoacyl-tRNA deacylase [Porphyromonas levii]MBR8715006.1 D-aminoacyl-tRNA deacylase [Porphyromonas levii]MBR8727454.1 D-aminoacyl-tRNA deacylase [Porphyromonas levii]MBR8729964.1 D-aminoacyl-tRNA deacylase [Porphyromonas levii]